MVKRRLTTTEMVNKFENSLSEKKGICIYAKWNQGNFCYFTDDLEVIDQGEIIHFEDSNGTECNLQQSSIQNIYLSNEDISEVLTIETDSSTISFMIV